MPIKSKNPAASKEKPSLQISAQQSRYAIDATDLPNTQEILIKDLSISLGQRELLARTDLHLCEAGRYVLVGRNGEGKSSKFVPIHWYKYDRFCVGVKMLMGVVALLYALASKQIPGLAWKQRILLLGQTRELSIEEQVGGLSVGEKTVLQHVVQSHVERERYMKEANLLSAALDGLDDSIGVIKAYRTVTHGRLLRKLDEQEKIAERRSGARGKDARKVLIGVEEEVRISEIKLNEDYTTLDLTTIRNETQAAVELLADIQAVLELMDASATEGRARRVLLGLGFTPEKIDGSMSKLSGGWRTRCDLACALCQECDVLLLDEPSNFLDLPSIIWLQNYINGDDLKDTTVLTVTHDRDLADAVGQDLIILRHKVLETFKGNLSTYEREKLKKIRHLTTMKDAADKQKKHMEQSVLNNIRAARKSGDDKKLKQAVSRQKRIDDRSGMQVNAKGGRFKLNRDLAGYHYSNRADFDIPDFDPLPKISFPSLPPDLRFPGSLISLENVSFRYSKSEPLVLSNISLTIHLGERYGLAGLNGSGKSTLIHLLSGSASPTTGTITRHPRCHTAIFNQHAIQHLSSLPLAHSTTALAHLMDFTGQADPAARAILSSLGLSGPSVSEIPLAALSGGQKVRLALAKLVWSAPHLLVLDEVTTHLDGETMLALVAAIRGYQGAVVVVTHDRFFMRCCVEGMARGALASRASLEAGDGLEGSGGESEDEDGQRRKGTVFRLVKGELRVLEGGMVEYEDIATRAADRLVKKWVNA